VTGRLFDSADRERGAKSSLARVDYDNRTSAAPVRQYC
jgi:hypothetical protein